MHKIIHWVKTVAQITLVHVIKIFLMNIDFFNDKSKFTGTINVLFACGSGGDNNLV